MFQRFFVLAGCAGIVALAACSPAPEPIRAIYPEPTFDKYGSSTGGGECPPGTTRGSNGALGTTANASSTGQGPCCPSGYGASANGEICVPIPYRDQGDNDGRTSSTPNDPTRG